MDPAAESLEVNVKLNGGGKKNSFCRLCVPFNEYVTFVEGTVWIKKSV